MRAGLVGEQIGHDAAAGELRNDVSAIAHQAHGHGLLFADGILENANRFVQLIDADIAITPANAALDALRVHFNAQKCGAVHCGGERLCSAHATHSTCHHQLAGKVATEVLRAAAAKVS